MARTPIEEKNVLLESTEPLSAHDKSLFAYFGENAKILPPYRILNPHRISIGDQTAIREGCHINAFLDLSFLLKYVEEQYRADFEPEEYHYESVIDIGRENQIGRFAFMSCTNRITMESNVLLSERVFIGDNNHGYSHPHVPIMQQPNGNGRPITIGSGTWIGAGAAILAGTSIGQRSVVGANSVCRGDTFPDRVIIASPSAVVVRSLDG